MVVDVSPRANGRLAEIWDYTAENWGEAQASKYVRGLVTHLELAAESRRSWQSVILSNGRRVYFVTYRLHRLFFSELGAGEKIVLLSVLHVKMDIPKRLLEDVEAAEHPKEL